MILLVTNFLIFEGNLVLFRLIPYIPWMWMITYLNIHSLKKS